MPTQTNFCEQTQKQKQAPAKMIFAVMHNNRVFEFNRIDDAYEFGSTISMIDKPNSVMYEANTAKQITHSKCREQANCFVYTKCSPLILYNDSYFLTVNNKREIAVGDEFIKALGVKTDEQELMISALTNPRFIRCVIRANKKNTVFDLVLKSMGLVCNDMLLLKKHNDAWILVNMLPGAQ
jgi:hypothetical protein